MDGPLPVKYLKFIIITIAVILHLAIVIAMSALGISTAATGIMAATTTPTMIGRGGETYFGTRSSG